MVWLLFYLIYCAIFFILANSKHLQSYKYLLPILLVIQIFDTGAAASNFRFKMSDTRAYNLKPYINSNDPKNIAIVKTLNSFWDSPLVSPEWIKIKDNYKKIIYVYPRNRPENAYPLVYFAAKNKLATNFGYFSRYKGSKKDEIYSKIDETINKKNYDADSIYVFDKSVEDKWNQIVDECSAIDLCKNIDGYMVFAKDFNLK